MSQQQPNWTNRTMWTGDNLDIMRGMNSDSVDLIYLDPPFNSNRAYEAPIGSEAAGAAFKDSWTLDDIDLAWHGEIADREPALYAVIEAAGFAHGKGMKSYRGHDGGSPAGDEACLEGYGQHLPALRSNSVSLSETDHGRCFWESDFSKRNHMETEPVASGLKNIWESL